MDIERKNGSVLRLNSNSKDWQRPGARTRPAALQLPCKYRGLNDLILRSCLKYEIYTYTFPIFSFSRNHNPTHPISRNKY